jgi:pyruvate dehydrogenase E2 component (dihydrolipoamide acetyltransferase)
MAERTTQSWTSVPHFFVTREVEAGALNAAREAVGMAQKQTPGLRLTHTDLLVALAARVLLKHPRVNASWSAEGIRFHDKVNLGVAIAVNDGVVMAVIHDAHTASLGEISSQSRAVTERARSGKLRPSDIADATFTISNLGMYHVDSFSAIITPPQSAILAVGAISDRVVAIDGKPAIRSMMTLTLSCDHRVADGARAAAFMNDLAEAIREPQRVLGEEVNSPS